MKKILKNCPKCDSGMKLVEVETAGINQKVKSFQCSNCDHFEFEEDSSKKIISELEKHPLKISQKIIKLSSNRLGIYFNKDVIRSLNLKNGEEVSISVPDKKHIVLELN